MTPDQALALIRKYYPQDGQVFNYLYEHSTAVAELAVKIAANRPELKANVKFVHSSALVHDIGIFMTYSPKIGCLGEYPYIAHGYLGRELLVKEGFHEHALVCERHVGVGISRNDIITKGFPLPHRDMIPISVEEQIVCYADLFYSKKPGFISIPKDPEKILKKLAKWGPDKPVVFEEFVEKFGLP